MKIYFETDMTEIPKNCMQYQNKGQCCYIYWSCKANREKVNLSHRPDWCPLRTEAEIKKEEKDNG
jgi:hypothetical protein